jgi:putative hemolysin
MAPADGLACRPVLDPKLPDATGRYRGIHWCAWLPYFCGRSAARAHALSQRQRQGSPFHLVTPSSTAIHPKKNPRL